MEGSSVTIIYSGAFIVEATLSIGRRGVSIDIFSSVSVVMLSGFSKIVSVQELYLANESDTAVYK